MNNKSTYNPISPIHDANPKAEPGKAIVVLRNNVAGEYRPESASIQERMLGYFTPWILASSGLVFLLVWIVFGFVGALVIGLLVLAGLVGFSSIYRENPVAQFFLGPTPSYFFVDVSRHEIIDERMVQIKDVGIEVTVRIEYSATVKAPVAVVQQGISDVRNYLSRDFYTRIAQTALQVELSDLSTMRTMLLRDSHDITDNDLFEISNVTFDVHAESDVQLRLKGIATAGLEIDEEGKNQELREKQRSEIQRLIANKDALMSEMVRPGADREVIAKVINVIITDETAQRDRQIELLKLAMEHGHIEPHRMETDFPGFADALRGAIKKLATPGSGSVQIENHSGKQGKSDSGEGGEDEGSTQ